MGLLLTHLVRRQLSLPVRIVRKVGRVRRVGRIRRVGSVIRVGRVQVVQIVYFYFGVFN